LVAAQAIEDKFTRARVLSGLAIHFPEILPEALTAAQAIEGDKARAKVLSGLASTFLNCSRRLWSLFRQSRKLANALMRFPGWPSTFRIAPPGLGRCTGNRENKRPR